MNSNEALSPSDTALVFFPSMFCLRKKKKTKISFPVKMKGGVAGGGRPASALSEIVLIEFQTLGIHCTVKSGGKWSRHQRVGIGGGGVLVCWCLSVCFIIAAATKEHYHPKQTLH